MQVKLSVIESGPVAIVRGMETIGSRIRHIRKTAGLSQEQFARSLDGVTRGAVGNWELNKGISRDNLQAIAKQWRVSLDWLADGRGEPPSKDDVDTWKSWIAMDAGRKTDDWYDERPDPARGRSTTAVPDLAIFAGMGGGGLIEVDVDDGGAPIDPDQVRGYWEFPEYMLRRFGNLRHVYAWEVRGDSMEPTLQGGAVVFVDTSQTVPPPDDIYALNYGDGLMVKRVKLVPRSDKVAIISDNDRYGTDELLREEVKIWGRVIGWFQWRG
jgi:phage repressor protein C with HTH and peptisase S24 domain